MSSASSLLRYVTAAQNDTESEKSYRIEQGWESQWGSFTGRGSKTAILYTKASNTLSYASASNAKLRTHNEEIEDNFLNTPALSFIMKHRINCQLAEETIRSVQCLYMKRFGPWGEGVREAERT